MYIKNRSTEQIQEIDFLHHLHPFTDYKSLGKKSRIIAKAKGIVLEDTDGKKMITPMARKSIRVASEAGISPVARSPGCRACVFAAPRGRRGVLEDGVGSLGQHESEAGRRIGGSAA